jgi:hypothetical protein
MNVTFSEDEDFAQHFIQQRKSFTFVPEKSNGTEDDRITLMNVPLLVSIM